jgi:hypothetical protein
MILERPWSVSVPAQGRGQLVACRLGNPVREVAAVRGQVGGAADVPGRAAQQRRREQDPCLVAGLPGRGVGGDLPEPGQRLCVGGDDVPEVIGRLVRRPYLHRLGQGRDGDPTRASGSGMVRGASIRSAPGRSPATSNSIRRAMSLMISSPR